MYEYIENVYKQLIYLCRTDPFKGGEVTVGEVYKKAKEICNNANTDQPFMCLDLTYIAVLLQDGYGLRPQTKIKVIIHLYVIYYVLY